MEKSLENLSVMHFSLNSKHYQYVYKFIFENVPLFSMKCTMVEESEETRILNNSGVQQPEPQMEAGNGNVCLHSPVWDSSFMRTLIIA